jgi:hypothetical protein
MAYPNSPTAWWDPNGGQTGGQGQDNSNIMSWYANRQAGAPPPTNNTNPEGMNNPPAKQTFTTQQAPPNNSPVLANGQPNPASTFAASFNPDSVVSDFRNNYHAYGGTTFNVPLPAAYAAGTLSKYAAPDQSANDSGISALVSKLLANPETMSPAVVNAMKEKAKESQLSMQDQLMGGLRHDALRRGINMLPLEEQANNNFIGNLTGSYRDLDLAANDRNRSDTLNAMDSASKMLADQLSRSQSNFNITHGTEMDQESLREAAAQSALANAGLNLDVQKAQAGDALAAADSNNQGAMFGAQLGQTSLSQKLALQNYLENNRQFNATANNNAALQTWLASQFPGGLG